MSRFARCGRCDVPTPVGRLTRVVYFADTDHPLACQVCPECVGRGVTFGHMDEHGNLHPEGVDYGVAGVFGEGGEGLPMGDAPPEPRRSGGSWVMSLTRSRRVYR